RNPKPETRNPKPETRNPNRNPKPETRNPKPETRNPHGAGGVPSCRRLLFRPNPHTLPLENARGAYLKPSGLISSGRVFIMNTISGISDSILVYLEALNEV
ncbi:hypothetical protein T484DRAFT_3640575, partial [Baffinella frigidus]